MAGKGAGKTSIQQVIMLQPAEYVDHISEDGHESTRLPYPFYVRHDGGVERQDFWRGSPLTVVGFQVDLAANQVDITWAEVVEDPKRCIGTYVVTENADGSMATHIHAISEATVKERG